MKGEYIYANGLNISQARKILKFIFRDFFIGAEKNIEKLRFDIFVKSKIVKNGELFILSEIIDIDDFNEYWNKDFSTGEISKNPPFYLLFIDPS